MQVETIHRGSHGSHGSHRGLRGWLARILVKLHPNSDMPWIAHFLTFDRVSSQNLDDSQPQMANVNNFELIEYLLNKNELEKLRSDFIVLVARVLREFSSWIYGSTGRICRTQAHFSQVKFINFVQKLICELIEKMKV